MRCAVGMTAACLRHPEIRFRRHADANRAFERVLLRQFNIQRMAEWRERGQIESLGLRLVADVDDGKVDYLDTGWRGGG